MSTEGVDAAELLERDLWSPYLPEMTPDLRVPDLAASTKKRTPGLGFAGATNE